MSKSKYKSDGWYADETIILISIIKDLNLNVQEITPLEWHRVSHAMSERGHHRSVFELSERYERLKNSYIKARLKNGTCEYYNYLNNLLNHLTRAKPEKDMEVTDDCSRSHATVASESEAEQKYAHTLQVECLKNNDTAVKHSLNAKYKTKKQKRCKWSDSEVEIFFSLISTLKLQAAILRKRNAKVFKILSKEMLKKSIIKGPYQIRIKYHQLRRQYVKAKDNDEETFKYFDSMHELLNAEVDGCTDLSDSDDEDIADMASKSENEGTIDLPVTRRRCTWENSEIELFFDLIGSLNLQSKILSKRNAKVFEFLSKEMSKRSCIKDPVQLRVKYHQLRRQYFKAKNYEGESFQYFESMNQLFSAAHNISESEEEYAEKATNSESEVTTESISLNRRCKWNDGEVDEFLNLISTMGLQTTLMRRTNTEVFELLSKEMEKSSISKSPESLRIKYLQLMRQYNDAKSNGENATFKHFEQMDQFFNSTIKTNITVDSELNNSVDEDDENQLRIKDTGDYYWTDVEIDAFLNIIEKNCLLKALDGSKKRNFKTLERISKQLAKQSFQRTAHQLRNKLRLLLKRYKEAKIKGIDNVRMKPRHFDVLDSLMQKISSKKKERNSLKSESCISSTSSMLEQDSDSEHSSSTCDLLKKAKNEGFDDEFEMPIEPTPIEVLTAIKDGQKELLTFLKTSNENFLRQQLEMQNIFLQEMSSMMRQEREETFRMLRELLPVKQ